jgi:hypothetical protein
MYVVQMTNSAGEAELCVWIFSTYTEAQQHARRYFTAYEDYKIVKMQFFKKLLQPA